MNNNNSRLIKILTLAAVLVLMLALCGCRTRITNNDEVSNVMYDEEGYLQEEYDLRRDELDLSKARKPIFTGFGSAGEEEYEYDEDYEMLEDYDYEDFEEYDDEEEPPAPKNRGTGQTGVRTGNTGNTTTRPAGTMVEVMLDPNGGVCSIKSMRMRTGMKYINLPTPTREGYTFEGWFTKKKGGKAVTSETEITNKEKHTLYAHWKKGADEQTDASGTYTITLNANGGTCDTEAIKVKTGDKYGDLPEPTREGYEFAGWYTKKSGGKKVTSNTKMSATKDHTLYAHWNKTGEEPGNEPGGSGNGDNQGGNGGSGSGDNQGGNGGSGSGDNQGGNGGSGSGDNQGGNGGSGSGDNQGGNGGNTPTPTPTPTPDVKKYTVSFDAGEGGAVTTTIEVTEGGTYGALPVPTREGYSFAGWFTAAEGGTEVREGDAVSNNSDHTLYAQWEETKYTSWSRKFDVAANDASEKKVYLNTDDDRKTDFVKACKGKIVAADESPEFILKFTDNMEEAVDTANSLRETYPDQTIIILSTESVKSGDNSVKLLYRLMLLDALNEDEFFGVSEISRAEEEMGVTGEPLFILPVE